MSVYKFSRIEDEQQSPISIDGASVTIPTQPIDYVDQFDSALKAVLTTSAQVERDTLARTVVYRHDMRKLIALALADGRSVLQEKWRKRPRDDAFFLMEENGATVTTIMRSGQSSDLGGYNEQMYKSLASKDDLPTAITEKHIDYVLSLLDTQTGMLVCESGAGLDVRRINHMQTNITSRGAHLICHDPSPLLAAVARTKVPNTPYISVPPYQEFLGRVLQKFEGAKALTMKNTLSSLTAIEVQTLIETAQKAKVDKIVVSQSVAMPMERLLEGGQKLMYELIEQTAKHEASKMTSHPDNQLILGCVIFQRALAIAMTALLEIMYRYFADEAKVKGDFKQSGLYASEGTDDLNEHEAQAFLESKQLALYLPEFNAGLFNEISFTPTSIVYKKVALPKGTSLRVKSRHTHLVCTRSENLPPNAMPFSYKTSDSGLKIPAFNALKRLYPHLKLQHIPTDRVSEANIEQAAGYVGLGILFDFFGRKIGVQPISQYCGTQFERSMYESFGVTVDS